MRPGLFAELGFTSNRPRMDARSERHRRLFHAGLTMTVLVMGLMVHRANLGLSAVFRDVLGDALWALMMFHALGAAFPRLRLATHVIVSLVLCFAVEFSQLYHTPWLDELRATVPGHLVLGSGFDSRDLVAYTIGVLAGWCIERARGARGA